MDWGPENPVAAPVAYLLALLAPVTGLSTRIIVRGYSDACHTHTALSLPLKWNGLCPRVLYHS